jgi:XTP/dITP diphosphohydrolase
VKTSLVLASNNPGKAREFSSLAAADPIDVVSAASVGGMPPVEETAGTFEGNARLKARALRPRAPSGSWILADDSGLCVDALSGAPGVHSARYAGASAGDAANIGLLLSNLEGVPDERRTAHFACVLFLIGPDGTERAFEGRCPGRILGKPRGSAGFGYDPVFAPDGFPQSFAELGEAVKALHSHRAVAWRLLARWLAGR